MRRDFFFSRQTTDPDTRRACSRKASQGLLTPVALSSLPMSKMSHVVPMAQGHLAAVDIWNRVKIGTENSPAGWEAARQHLASTSWWSAEPERVRRAARPPRPEAPRPRPSWRAEVAPRIFLLCQPRGRHEKEAAAIIFRKHWTAGRTQRESRRGPPAGVGRPQFAQGRQAADVARLRHGRRPAAALCLSSGLHPSR